MMFRKVNNFLAFSMILLFALSCKEQMQKPKHKIDEDLLLKIERANTIGKPLFITNCSACHKLENQCGGPELATAMDRWPDKKLFKEYIKDAESVLKKSEYARKLRVVYNVIPGHQFPRMTDDDVDAIINYIKLKKAEVIK